MGSTALPEMPCQDLVELVTHYFDDALTPRDRARFEAHLGECGPCRDYLEQLRRTIELAGRLAPDSLSPEARDALLAAFRGWRAA